MEDLTLSFEACNEYLVREAIASMNANKRGHSRLFHLPDVRSGSPGPRARPMPRTIRVHPRMKAFSGPHRRHPMPSAVRGLAHPIALLRAPLHLFFKRKGRSC